LAAGRQQADAIPRRRFIVEARAAFVQDKHCPPSKSIPGHHAPGPGHSKFAILYERNFHEADMTARSEAKKAKLENPANHYNSPDDIVNDDDLSPDEKMQALNTWEQDARQMLTASNEGMPGDREGLDRRDSHRLDEVVRAKDKIGAKPKHKQSH
jgi:hypothetical protein